MNPFVELYRSPVTTLTALGYALGLAALVFATLGACWRNAITLRVQWIRQRPRQWEYVPPATFLLRCAAIPLVLAIDAWAVAALIWLVF